MSLSMKHRSYFFLMLCWLAYFAVPLVNGFGQSGVQRIEICTTQGVESYFVSTADTPSEQASLTSKHGHSHSCPCTHFSIDTAITLMVLNLPHSVSSLQSTTEKRPIIRTLSVSKARAPPATTALSDDQKLA